ncbi:MscL family protein [Bradyrhizobium prioriisuperbiae]|uniref:MscL family protein n=1 Tax=Bradyrhizobium prioriisuperbiae TaxID=2854389 RepID=UPI0028E4CE1A|nr:MscL family protein [Bradyrhizobium prioritasuperba]
MKGHVADIAVGIMIGTVFGAILTLALNAVVAAFIHLFVGRSLNTLKHEAPPAAAEPPKPTRRQELLHRAITPIAAVLAAAIWTMGLHGTTARADNPADERRPQDAPVQRTVLPAPARVILPAPWEPATPTRPATAPVESAGSRK